VELYHKLPLHWSSVRERLNLSSSCCSYPPWCQTVQCVVSAAPTTWCQSFKTFLWSMTLQQIQLEYLSRQILSQMPMALVGKIFRGIPSLAWTSKFFSHKVHVNIICNLCKSHSQMTNNAKKKFIPISFATCIELIHSTFTDIGELDLRSHFQILDFQEQMLQLIFSHCQWQSKRFYNIESRSWRRGRAFTASAYRKSWMI